jgi:two-component system, cell cycle sensor histidine kinase and response regulator CckA
VPTLLIADDEPVVLSVLASHLEAPGRTILTAQSFAEALRHAETSGPIDVALLDKNLGDGSGLKLAQRVKELRRETEVILVTAYASFETAVEALKVGLYDYLSKPIDDFDAVRLKVDNALEKVRLQAARRQTETELRHMQKMDAVGRLAGGIGHDLANMLAVVLSWTEELSADSTGPMREGLAEIRNAADRATRLVRHMMTLSRRGPAEPVRVPVEQVLHEMTKLLGRALGTKIALVTELADPPWPVFIDPALLGQVFLNLAVNARDAMPDGGRIIFRTVNLPSERLLPEQPAGPVVRLSVTDEGTGMSSEVQERVFEPFFTTKRAGEGTGLGLAIVYGIVRQAGGTIEVESALGKGTTFRISLPRAADEVAPEVRTGVKEQGVGEASGTALLAEDDAPVRALMARALRRAGLDVLEAPSAEAALDLMRAHRGPIDIVVCDAVMPGRSGAALTAEVRRSWPACRALLVTGFPADPEVIGFAGAGGTVVQKPFVASSLVDAVRVLLARPPGVG